MNSKDIQYFLMKCNKIEKLILHGGRFENHFKNLGSMIFQIESYKSFGEIIKDLETIL